MIQQAQGRCLCGAVTLIAHDLATGASACHCGQCRRWTGSAVWSWAARSIEASGPVRTFRASPFAERAFCGTCGSHLWIHDDDGDYDLAPGLFDEAGDVPLIREIYVDRALACVPLTGDHARLSSAEYEATERHVPSLQ